uniref:Uncharacterized protein n=4 Tax=Avena sativa TaxID=4498 RepID=A0ACD5VDZ8_AVESA
MFIVCSFSVRLLETVASLCRLTSYAYLREVGGDGSVLGGIELEIAAVGDEGTPTLFWSCVSSRSCCPYEDCALQAVRFLKRLYGFVISDFNYEGMVAYRELARYAIVLAVSIARSVSSCF